MAVLFTEQSHGKSLGSIAIEGVDSRTTKIILEQIKQNIRDNFTTNDVQEAIGAIYSVGPFNGIEAYYEEVGSKTNIIFKVTPVRFIRSIKLSGNKTVGNVDLLTEFGIAENEGFSEDRIKLGLENIKKYYNLAGFLNAQVSADFKTSDSSSNIVILIQIDEQAPCMISEIKFNSVNANLNKTMQKLFKSNNNRIFSQALLLNMQNEALEHLLKERFLNAQIQPPEVTYDASRTKVALNYVINEPYRYALVFEGNEIFGATKILKALKLDTDNKLSNSPSDDLNERIIRFYKTSGYANISVKHKETLFSEDYIRRVIFEIKEGPRVRIKDITIEGVFSRPQKYYRNFIIDHSGDLVNSKIYNSEEMDNGVKNLVTELQNQGFIAAKVTGTRADFDKLRESVVVQISLDEGPQTIIDKIIFNGIKSTTQKELEETIGLRANTHLQLSVLEESTSKIVELYRSRGYLDIQVVNQGKSIIKYNEENTKATLKFEIEEGPLITVSGIAIEGNDFTKDFVIARELQFKPGDVLTPEKISYSEERLQRLSLFTATEIRTMQDDPREGHRTVLVRVVENDPGIVKGGVGISNDFGLSLKGFLGAAYRNLFGTGRGVNARVELNHKVNFNFLENDINFGYTEPFIFGTNNIARLNLIKSTKLFSVEQSTDRSGRPQEKVYAVDSSQADLLFERDLTRKLKLVYQVYGITRSNKFEIHDYDVSKPLNIATTGPTFLLDRRDNPFNPTRGDLSTLSFEYSNPSMGSTSSVNYYKTVGSYTRYIPMGPVVWANEGKAGFLKNLGDYEKHGAAVPQIKAFYLGGRSSIRGFNAFSESVPLPADIRNGITTESHFFLTKSELRFPLYGNLGGAVFYDGGAVRIPGMESYRHTLDWRHSAGVGVRYNTPVGPVSLEYARKLNQDSSRSESDYQIHFSIGVF